ncbi:tRNA (N(6)-L-threonylcarbamoyladenosine(37)-C(2))-methylthiotransferase MtaB [Eubacterium xylanophilum]|uniref:tRNA (N(6)-L-threonylcarbamoyladenosine(37)-C(2))- methylthiotransferase MtaB n=1 Tax=Eubacterium xylanophilum TaxID=39497 RepID=UPI00047ADCBF|nr:tRNA (N(6)-L-threonylcarbamoyladenosine(37)-C(2))-methylthiotransferase MtaB [Eubacterium xylanophilum]
MRAAFLTLGCKVNYYETEKMMKQFTKLGHDVVEFSDVADVYVINTCTVTNIADRKSRQMIHRAKKNSPNSIIVATGCYVDVNMDNLPKDSGVDFFFSNKDKANIAEKLIERLQEESNQDQKVAEIISVDFQEHDAHTVQGRVRKYIKVQDGCNQFCTYCMIPFARGRGELVSTPEDVVVSEIEELANNGTKEVVVTGIHLSSYGVDFVGAKNFVELKGKPLLELLEKINAIKGIERIRLGSLEPRIICKEFLEGLSKIDKICPHFHLSLQSGCDSVLKRMNRHYTTVEYMEKCSMIREYYEHPAITTDIIVGFPGETDEEFSTTVRFVENVGFADVHVFPYSIRKGTRAANMPNQVDGNIKKERTEKLIKVASDKKVEFEEYFTGKEVRVLLEEVREVDGEKYIVGHNERYVMFRIPIAKAEESGYGVNDMIKIIV